MRKKQQQQHCMVHIIGCVFVNTLQYLCWIFFLFRSIHSSICMEINTHICRWCWCLLCATSVFCFILFHFCSLFVFPFLCVYRTHYLCVEIVFNRKLSWKWEKYTETLFILFFIFCTYFLYWNKQVQHTHTLTIHTIIHSQLNTIQYTQKFVQPKKKDWSE